ncbi:MAG: hypothetical protein ACFHVJ_14540 [Aestuariibacter sp.]
MTLFYNVTDKFTSLVMQNPIELLNTLLQMSQTYQTLTGEDIQSTIDKLTSMQNALENGQEIMQVLEGQGLSQDQSLKLVALLANFGLDDSEQEIAKTITYLLTDVANLPHPVNWPLNVADTGQLANPPEGLALSGNFSLNAGLTMQYRGTVHELAGKLSDNTSKLEYGIQAKVHAGADLAFSGHLSNLPVGISAGANARAGAQVRLFTPTRPGTALFRSLIDDFSVFDEIPGLEAFLNGKVEALTLDFNGALTAHADMTLGYQWQASDKVSQPLVKNLSAEINVGAGMKWQLEGQYQLLSYITSEGKLAVEIQCSTTESQNRYLSVAANVSTPGLKAVAAKQLQQLTGYTEELEEFLEQFSNPKEHIQTLIKAQLTEQPDWQQELVNVAIGTSDDDALRTRLSEQLSSAMDEPLSRFYDWFNDEKARANEIALMAKTLGFPQVGDAVDTLSALVKTTVDNWHLELKTKLLAMANTGASNVLAPIQSFGLKVDATLNDVNSFTEEKLQPVYRFLKQFKSKLRVFEDFVENTMIENIGFEFNRIATHADSEQAVFAIEFDLTNESRRSDIAKLYAQCLIGDLSHVIQLHKQNKVSGVFTLGNSLLTSMQENTLTTSLAFNLFGLHSLQRTIMSEKVKFQRNGFGELIIASADSEFTLEESAADESNKIVVSTLSDLLGNNEDASRCTINYIYSDKDLEKSELFGFLNAFEELKLIPAHTSQKSYEVLKDSALLDSKKAINIQIQLSMILNRSMIVHAATNDSDTVYQIALNNYIAGYEAYVNLESGHIRSAYLDIMGCYPGESFKNAVVKLLNMSSRQARKKIENVLEQQGYRFNARGANRGRSKVNNALYILNYCEKAATATVDYVSSLAHLVQGVNFTALDDQQVVSLKAEKAQELRELNELLENMVRESHSTYTWNLDAVHPVSLGFVKTMQQLTGEGMMIPVIYKATDDNTMKPLLVI